MAKKVKTIGIMTSGGDCPGLNGVIRAATRTAINDYGMRVYGILDGYEGLVDGRYMKLDWNDVSGILTCGGTILGTSNKADPIGQKRVGDVFKNCRKMKLDALICAGGDGSMNISYALFKRGLNVVGIPKTIDNDLEGTDVTFGFDSAVQSACNAIDAIHTTAQSHHRVMIIEVMGRYAGWIALYSGIASGGDIILIPEIPFDINKVCDKVKERHRHGKRFSIIVIAEGAKPFGGELTVRQVVKDSPDQVRLGGIGNKIAYQIENLTGIETRVTVLGHLLRGGSPTAFDRILATRFGSESVKAAAERKFGYMVALKGTRIGTVKLQKAIKELRLVKPNAPIIRIARALGTSFGN
ncbi:MAG: ATP-dependent 6-phosphofructokinase [Candidatus Omnitrophota bacterium]